MDSRTAGPATKDDAYDVSDPTDWFGTPLSSLMQVEQSLRCHVCKDFFQSPLITSCSHTFCSLCIRRALNTDGKCPLCRTPDQESKLRGNWAIREAVEAFVSSREVMLDLARRPLAGETSAGPFATTKRKAREGSTNGESTSKRTRMSTRSSSARAAITTAAMMEQEADVPEAEEVEEYVPACVTDDGLVACPICQWRMKPERVDKHLDTDCPGEPQPQPSPSKTKKTFGLPSARSSGTPPAITFERIPSTNYSLLNDTKLKKKLADLGIPTWGSRLLLEKRHKEWVMIWNANCDSARPKTKRELMQDLDTWERTQGGNASTMSLSANLGAQIKDKDFDGAGWSAKHNNSFNNLISQARKSHKKVEDRTRDVASSFGDKTDSEQPRVNGTRCEHSPELGDVDAAHPKDGPIRTSEIIDLSSPRKIEGARGADIPSGDSSIPGINAVTGSASAGAPS
ncbi:hypothetical protein M406DRAFT_252418 [Cryphonectria parasitica EP155]|uniref:Postreplication repair E3 ubiquitin-protein ligase RAD18 n=1 Tax=Cryphonectria parasitica (strain ATCC 38755 / EP155) TaxID=660469 RepID=A0A9P5CRQ1_CRYP1|nr:uncharacterized protein M406DRAFT_252418 [Cryphonectria parasitica EP155]KAF3767511.1 hypothetical protein M406DRAFT_252418 [Cryphonectria parasitica EP155]